MNAKKTDIMGLSKDLQQQMSLKELEDYIKPTKEKMRDLYTALFDSAQRHETHETEKEHLLVCQNLMIEASRGIKALEECSLLVNLDKAKTIAKRIGWEQIRDSSNDILKKSASIPKAMQALKAYLTRLELAEIEPVIKALLSDNRKNKHVSMIRKLLKDELRKNFMRLERIKRHMQFVLLKERMANKEKEGSPIRDPPKEPHLNTGSERKFQRRAQELIASRKKEKQRMNRDSEVIDSQLKHLKFEIATSAQREKEKFRHAANQKVNQSVEVEQGNSMSEEKAREMYKKDCSYIYYQNERKIFTTVAGSHQKLPGPLGYLCIKYQNPRNKFYASEVRPNRDKSQDPSQSPPRPANVTPHLTKVEPKFLCRKATNPEPQKLRRGKLILREDLTKLLDVSESEERTLKSRNALGSVPMFPRKIINVITHEQSKAEAADELIKNCDDLHKNSARDLVDIKKHESNVADLYVSLQKQLEDAEDRESIDFINKQIEKSIHKFRRDKGCFVYGSRGQGRYINSTEDGKVKDFVRETDALLDSDCKRERDRQYRLKPRFHAQRFENK